MMKFNIGHSWRQMAFCVIAGVVVAHCGCGPKEWKARTYPATGTMRINGEIPAGALITLAPTGPAFDVRESKPWGLVKEDGTYAFSTYDHEDGVPPGEYRVSIFWPVAPGSGVDRLSNEFSKPDKPVTVVTIAQKKNELPLIELNSAKILKVPPPKPDAMADQL